MHTHNESANSPMSNHINATFTSEFIKGVMKKGTLNPLLLVCLFMLVTFQVHGQESDELQSLVDQLTSVPLTRASEAVTEIDLSTFSEPRTTTLYIRNGVNIRFVNGTLRRASSLTDAPLIEIKDNSRLELSKTAIISGNRFKTDTQALIDIYKGVLDVDGGQIVDNESNLLFDYGPSVMLREKEGGCFIMSDGKIEGTIVNIVESNRNAIEIEGGSSFMSNYGTYRPHIQTNSDVTLSGRARFSWIIMGQSGLRINLTSSLTSKLTITGPIEADQCILSGKGYTISQEDLKYLLFSRQGTYTASLEDNEVFLRLSKTLTIDGVDPGALSSAIDEESKNYVEELTISGRLNGTDIKLIREMANAKLKKLDISECYIVEGGGPYVEVYTNTDFNMVHDQSAKSKESSGRSLNMVVGRIGLYTDNNVIGSCMFRELSALEYLRLPNSVTTISKYAFADCPNLKTVIVGANTMSVYYDVFKNSKSIVDAQFTGCKYLHEENGAVYDANYKNIQVAVPNISGVLTIRNSVDSIKYPVFQGQERITKVELPDNLVYLSAGVFEGCTSLKEITSPQSLCSISYGTFADCDLNVVDLSNTKLKGITGSYYKMVLPDLYFGPRGGAFSGNENITEIRLPATIEYIGGNAFTSSKIQNIYSYAITPPSINVLRQSDETGSSIIIIGIDNSPSFQNINYETCIVHVPRGSAVAYMESNWKTFANIVEDLPNDISNYIESEDELQARIDEIAASGDKKAELVIAEDGITLTKGVYVRAETDITLTGGTISLADSFNDNSVFYLEKGAYLTYDTITFDLRNVYLPTSFVQSLELSTLNVSDNVEFVNIYKGPKVMTKGFFYCCINISPNSSKLSLEINNGSVIYGWGSEINLRNCNLRSNGGYPTIAGNGFVYMYDNTQVFGDGNASSVIDLPQGGVCMRHGKNTLVHADNYGGVINAVYGDLVLGKLEGGSVLLNYVVIQDNIDLAISQMVLRGDKYEKSMISGGVRLPILYVMNGVKILLTSSITDTWIIDGDWESFNVDEPYALISGYNYTVANADYSKMEFANLPDNLETDYDKDSHTVFLQENPVPTLADLLQCLVDGNKYCFPQDVTEVGEGETEIGCEDPLQCAIDATIDGARNPKFGGSFIPTIHFCECIRSVIRVHRGSSLTLRNINIEASGAANQFIYVAGTLIIDVNVYIRHFRRFIHILPGGRVIWRGSHVEDVTELVHNEGGTLELEGDFDNGGKRLTNPEGCTIIIKGGTFNGSIENYGTILVEGGIIRGGIDNYGSITIRGGVIDSGNTPGIGNHSGGTVIISGGKVKCDGGDIYDVYNYNGGSITIFRDVEIGENGNGCIWSETDIWIDGSAKVKDIYIQRGCRIHVLGKINLIWHIHFFVFNDFDIYVPFIIGDRDYYLTKEDFNHIQIDLPEGYRCTYSEGTVLIVRIPYDVATIVEYLNYFGPQGSLENPWSFVYNKTSINIDIDWHIQKDYHLIFDGGTFDMNEGDIYIEDGASLWLKNITFKGSAHHIYIYGTLYIDENVNLAQIAQFIHICRGGEIRFIAKQEYVVNVVIEETEIVTNVAIIHGIKKEWLQFLHIDLPDGYDWKYDDNTHTITILLASGISEIREGKSEKPVYDLFGNRMTTTLQGLPKGIYVSDGHKVVVK